MLEAPKHIELIWVKPGREWTEKENYCVQEWLNSEPQLTRLRIFALRHLTAVASWQDAEDAWGDFNAQRLNAVITSFDPGAAQSSFPGYLLICFKRYIWKRPKPVPAPEPRPDEDDDSVDLIASPESLPSEIAELGDRIDRMKACLDCLAPKFRLVVTLHYFEDYPCTEISKMLSISVNLVKLRLFRARQMLKQILNKESVTL